MISSYNLLGQIKERLESLNRSERKVADVILADPQAATRFSIAYLAKSAGVSEPSVNRFCKKFQAKGFPDFKLQLAQALVAGVPYVSRNVEADDEAASYTAKIFDSTVSSLLFAKEQINTDLVDRAVNQLIQAKQILFFGVGASGPVAQDAQHKFFRFNIPVTAYDDVLMQRMAAAACGTGDVVVVISYTGRTKELVEIATLARKSEATVIGITAPESPLAAQCSLVLGVEAPEDTDVYMPMTSRIVHLALLDVLATGVTLKRGPGFLSHLKKIKDSLQDTRFKMDMQVDKQQS